MPVEFPSRHLGALVELGARLIDSRKSRTPLNVVARDLLLGFHDVCTHAGLDRVLDELARAGLGDPETVEPAVVAQLEMIDLDGGGPRNARPRQLADCVVAALALTVVDAPDRSLPLGDDVRAGVAAALASVLDVELAPATLRAAIVAGARARLDERHHASFDKLAAQLDDRGLQIVKTPKIPIDALHAAQRALHEARDAVIDRVGRIAIDRAQAVIARADAGAAARIDLPITLRATPREVAIVRACDARVGKTPALVANSLLASLTELVPIAWRVPEQKVLAYSATKTFAIGDVIEHPKFGRGTVLSDNGPRIDVEFSDGKHTLVHVAPRR